MSIVTLISHHYKSIFLQNSRGQSIDARALLTSIQPWIFRFLWGFCGRVDHYINLFVEKTVFSAFHDSMIYRQTDGLNYGLTVE